MYLQMFHRRLIHFGIGVKKKKLQNVPRSEMTCMILC